MSGNETGDGEGSLHTSRSVRPIDFLENHQTSEHMCAFTCILRRVLLFSIENKLALKSLHRGALLVFSLSSCPHVLTRSMATKASPITKTGPLGFPYETPDPFLFCELLGAVAATRDGEMQDVMMKRALSSARMIVAGSSSPAPQVTPRCISVGDMEPNPHCRTNGGCLLSQAKRTLPYSSST